MTELATLPVEDGAGVTRISHWIGGKTVAGTSGRTSPVYNPATGEQTADLPLSSVDEVNAAAAAAKTAAIGWATTPPPSTR